MHIQLFAWVGKWDVLEKFSGRLTERNFVENLPSRTKRKLYVTKRGRLVHIRFPWKSQEEVEPMAEITLTEAEVFLLVKFARRNRTDEELLKAISVAN